jgi:hypothetical protein
MTACCGWLSALVFGGGEDFLSPVVQAPSTLAWDTVVKDKKRTKKNSIFMARIISSKQIHWYNYFPGS